MKTMENLDLLKCPNCEFTMDEPTVIDGKNVIIGHNCYDGKYAGRWVIGEGKKPKQLLVTKVADWTEKEHRIVQTKAILQIEKNSKRISNNVLFFFWMFIVSFILSVGLTIYVLNLLNV